MAVTIKTDHKWHYFKYGYELSQKERIKWRKEFSYIKSNEEFYNRNFAKYRGQLYDINEFMSIKGWSTEPFGKAWDGYMSDTYFSGVVIKISKDGERYKIGRYYS